MANLDLYLEAERRGILPEDKAGLLNEARNRGLIPKIESQLKPDEGLGGALKERVKSAGEIKQAYKSGDIGAARAAEQAIGKVGFGTMSDVAGAAISGAAKAITPEPIKDVLSQKVKELSETSIGKAGIAALQSGSESWNKFKTENPNIARDIESVSNIAGWLIPAKAIGTKAVSKIPSIEERKLSVQAAYKPLQGKPLEDDVRDALERKIENITPNTEVSLKEWKNSGALESAQDAIKSSNFDDLRKVRSALQDKINAAYKAEQNEKAADLVKLKKELTYGLEGIGGDDFLRANHAAKIESTIESIEGMEKNIQDMINPSSALHTRVRNYYNANEKFLTDNQKKALKDVLKIYKEPSATKVATSKAAPIVAGGLVGTALGGGGLGFTAGTAAGAYVGAKISAKAGAKLLERQLDGLNKFKEVTYKIEPPLPQRSTIIGNGSFNQPIPRPAPVGYLESPETIKNREFIRGAQAKERGYQQRQIVSRAKQAAEASIKPRPTIPMTGGQALLESPQASSRRRIVESGIKKLKKQKTLEQIKRGK